MADKVITIIRTEAGRFQIDWGGVFWVEALGMVEAASTYCKEQYLQQMYEQSKKKKAVAAPAQVKVRKSRPKK